MKSALRDFLLCLQCCIMESRSPLPQEGGVTVRRRRIEASILGKKFGPILRASPSSFLGKEPALRESPSYCISHAKHGGSENHKTGPAARRKCTPIPAFGGTSPKGKHVTGFSGRFTPLQIQFLCHPGGGSLLSAYLSANLSCSFHSAAKISPSGGDAAAGGRRGAFPTRQRRGLHVFLRPSGRLFGFIILAAKPPTTTLTPKACQTLAPLEPSARRAVTPRGRRPCPYHFISMPINQERPWM